MRRLAFPIASDSGRGCRPRRFVLILAIAVLVGLACTRLGAAASVNANTRAQIESLLEEKASRTPAQRKMDSQLVYHSKQSRNQPISPAVPTLDVRVRKNSNGLVLVDIRATVSPELLGFIAQSGGTVVNSFARFDAIRAWLPVGAFETIAARADVRFLEPAREAIAHTGSVTSEGDRTHRADTARATFPTNGGNGLKIGVLSDGVDSLAASKANGNLNANTTVISGQAGSGNEGTAMMEIIQDIVPGAQLYFATAFNGASSMASNILALQAAGCTIIVDDVTYFYESPFQDQEIAQAVNTVSATGVMYFSSAGNSGSKDKGTSGTWEGDWADGGATTVGSKAGNMLDFGGGVTANTVTAASQPRADLFWADPLGASTNDYDLFVVNNGGAVMASSTNIQNGSQDPYESVGSLSANQGIVIVKTTGAAARFLHLDTGRSQIQINTAGNTRGHNASGATNAFTVSAAAVTSAPSPNYFVGGATNPAESFTSDGPRRKFFLPDGTPITAGNFSSTGGQVLNKPDFTAADGVTTSVSGFSPFYGTSAAAPHAAAVAALLKSYNPALTPAQIRSLLTSTALDIEAAGYDRVSGSGIVMALAAIQAAPAPDPLSITASGLDATGPVGGPFTPSSGTYTLTNNSGASLNWSAGNTQSWTTFSSTSGTLAAGGSTVVTLSINANANALPVGIHSDTITITNTSSGFVRTFQISLTAGTPHATLFDSYTGASPAFINTTPRTFMGFPPTLSNVSGTSNITVASGTAYLVSTAVASYANVRLNITFWGTASGVTSGSSPAFSNQLGAYSFDLGPLNATANTFYVIPFTLPAPLVMPGQTGGVTINWQGDTGGGLANTDQLTTLIRLDSALAVGSMTIGTAGTNGFYYNLSGQTDGNFPGSDFVFFSGRANQGLALQLFGPPAPPLALTNAASAVGSTGATLNASVNPAGAATTASFQYGTTTGYGNTATITLSPNNGTSAQNVTASLTGLAPGTLYHFRVTAGNAFGTTNGRDLTFTTAASGPPTITGAVAGQAVNDNATVAPFSGITIGDVDVPAQTLSVSVTLDTAAKGSFTTLNGFTNAGSGVYTFSGTAAAATTAIRGLVFTPTANRVPAGSTETTTLTISANDGTGPVTNNTTTVVATSMNDFTTWAQSKFTQAELANSAISGPNAVYGLDGLPNLLKYALGLEPKTNITSGLPNLSVVGTDWVFTYVRPAGLTDITYSVQVSTDLTTWTTAGVTHEFVSSGGGSETWRGRYPLSSANNAFFRLNVTQN